MEFLDRHGDVLRKGCIVRLVPEGGYYAFENGEIFDMEENGESFIVTQDVSNRIEIIFTP
jgi:hypothetical protein